MAGQTIKERARRIRDAQARLATSQAEEQVYLAQLANEPTATPSGQAAITRKYHQARQRTIRARAALSAAFRAVEEW